MDFKQIQSIIKDFEKSSITSLEIELDGFKIKLSKQNISSEVHSEISNNSETLTETSTDPNLTEVKAPLVGTFYITSAQGEEFVKTGDEVQEGQTLCIIEAMKIMNEITAPKSGIIQEIKVKNGEPVGFDQLLMLIK